MASSRPGAGFDRAAARLDLQQTSGVMRLVDIPPPAGGAILRVAHNR